MKLDEEKLKKIGLYSAYKASKNVDSSDLEQRVTTQRHDRTDLRKDMISQVARHGALTTYQLSILINKSLDYTQRLVKAEVANGVFLRHRANRTGIGGSLIALGNKGVEFLNNDGCYDYTAGTNNQYHSVVHRSLSNSLSAHFSSQGQLTIAEKELITKYNDFVFKKIPDLVAMEMSPGKSNSITICEVDESVRSNLNSKVSLMHFMKGYFQLYAYPIRKGLPHAERQYYLNLEAQSDVQLPNVCNRSLLFVSTSKKALRTDIRVCAKLLSKVALEPELRFTVCENIRFLLVDVVKPSMRLNVLADYSLNSVVKFDISRSWYSEFNSSTQFNLPNELWNQSTANLKKEITRFHTFNDRLEKRFQGTYGFMPYRV